MILQAARDEFTAHAFAEASVNRIIAAAGISKGSLYYYFDDKDDLFSTCLSQWIGELLDGVEGRVTPVHSSETFWEESEYLITYLAEQVNQTSGFAAMVAHGLQARVQNKLRLRIDEVEQRLIGALTAIFDTGMRVGALRNDLDQDFMLALAFAMARPSDEWLVSAKDIEQARMRARTVSENYRRLFQV